MTVGVVIPLFDKERTILRSIQSVLEQTYQNFQIVVVDDGSTDDSLRIVKELSDKRITIHSQTNSGVSSARNCGANLLSTEWVCFLDGDDEYESNFLETIVAATKSHPDQQLVFLGTGYRSSSEKADSAKSNQSTVVDFFEQFTGQATPICSSSVCVRREGFLAQGGYSEAQSQFEDWGLYFTMAMSGKFACVPAQLAVYHEDERSGSNSHDFGKLSGNAELFLQKVYADLENGETIDSKVVRSVKAAACRFYQSITSYMIRHGARREVLRLILNQKAARRLDWKLPLFSFRFWAHMLVPDCIKRLVRST